MTNGGGDTEQARSELVNRRMFGKEAEGPHLLSASQMICCHTPLRKKVPAFGDKFVLISGNKDVMEVCEHYGFEKAIHVEELYALMPGISPLVGYEYPEDIR